MNRLYKENYLHMIHQAKTIDTLQRLIDCASVDLNLNEWREVIDAARDVRARLTNAGKF